MKIILFYISFLVAAISLSSCNTAISSIEEFNEWLNDDGNGCIAKKNLAGIRMTLKYIPDKYLDLQNKKRKSWNEKKHNNGDTSLLQSNVSGYNFLMTIGPDKEVEQKYQASGVMFEGIHSYQEYTERLLTMNFFMDQYLKLYVDGVGIMPKLVIAENVYELSDARNFNIVFEKNDTSTKDVDEEITLVYSDPYFGMGNVQFSFSKKALENADNLELILN